MNKQPMIFEFKITSLKDGLFSLISFVHNNEQRALNRARRIGKDIYNTESLIIELLNEKPI